MPFSFKNDESSDAPLKLLVSAASDRTFMVKLSDAKLIMINGGWRKEMWDKYGVNIDCVENLVSLCPTCHKAFHYGSNEVKSKLIEQLFAKCEPKFRIIGLNISLEESKKLYKV